MNITFMLVKLFTIVSKTAIVHNHEKYVDLPGVSMEDIDISLEQNMLKVNG
jgi:HSP20 family molecular chaperone IbpA